MSDQWDVALTHKKPPAENAPARLSRALRDKGFNRVKVTLTADGLLLRPYVADEGRRGYGSAIDLPDWGTP